MTNHIVVSDPENQAGVIDAIKKVVNGSSQISIKDVYGNVLDPNEVTYQFVPADSNAKVNDAGWPCAEGLYTIVVHPYDADGENQQLQQNTDFSVKYYKVGTDGAHDTEVTDTSKKITDADVGNYYAVVIATENGNYRKEIKLPFQVVKKGTYLFVTANPQEVIYEPVGHVVTLMAKKSEEDVTAQANFTFTQYTEKGSKSFPVSGATFTATDVGTYVVEAKYTTGTGDDESIITFEPSSGYTLGVVQVNGTATTVTGNTLTLQKITEDMAVIVTFQSTNFTVNTPESKTYTGSALEPDLTVLSGGDALEANNYAVSYAIVAGTGAALDGTGNPLTAGTYTVTVTGIDGTAYAGKTATTVFVIEPKQITEAMVEVKENADGTALTVTVTDGDKTLIAGVDYTVSQSGNVTPGADVTVTVTGIGNYKDTVSEVVEISGSSQWTLTYMNGTTQVGDVLKYAKGNTVTVLGQGDLTEEKHDFLGGAQKRLIQQPCTRRARLSRSMQTLSSTPSGKRRPRWR